MNRNRENNVKKTIMEQTLDRLGKREEAPVIVCLLLLLLYVISALTVSLTAGSQRVVIFGGNPVSIYTFAGVFASVSNLCIVLMVVFCGTRGFIASVAVLLVQCPMILAGIIARGNLTSLPGLFGNLLTFIVVCFIRVNNRKLDDSRQKLREQASTDILTGLPNGFASTELINGLIRENIPFAAVTIDINNFKSINDLMGFDMGNKALVEIASRWRSIADGGLSGTNDFITRINGDEFSLIVRDYSSEEEVVKTIRLYKQALEEKLCTERYEFVANASFGYALFPEDGQTRDALITNSVAAMKEIKRINSSEHILHFSSDLLNTHEQLIMENKVRDALEHDRIGFNLQPQFDMSHRLRGFEALARMKDENGDSVSPVEFIPAAEKAGLIDSLDVTVYRKASAFFGEIIKRTGADIVLCINASVKHLMKNNFVDEIREILTAGGMSGEHLEVEITESIMIESAEKAIDCLKKLTDVGVRIAIDDFGTGYSSLSYLNIFPSEILKIDKSFIDKINEEESETKYVEAIISLAHVLDYRVIAEGVEEQEQLDILRRIGCDYIQGFFWGRPLSAEDAGALVTESFPSS